MSVVFPAPRKPVLIVTGTLDRSDMAFPRAPERDTAGLAGHVRPARGDGRARQKHPLPRGRAAPATQLRRSDRVTVRDHPLDQARATGAPAGLLARGSQLDAHLPRLAFPTLSSGCSCVQEHVHRAIRLQLQGQPRIWKQASAPHSRLSPLRGTGAIIEGRVPPFLHLAP